MRNDDYFLLFNARSPTFQQLIRHDKIESGVSEVTVDQSRESVATLQAVTFSDSQRIIASFLDVSAKEVDIYLDYLKPPRRTKETK